MSRIRMLPYKIGSQSCKVLARELGLLRCNPLNTRFVPRELDIIINWGCGTTPDKRAWHTADYLNFPFAVRRASNKINALGYMDRDRVSVIPFTTNVEVAQQWLEEEGSYVYERHTTTGHGGMGINVVHSGSTLNPNVPLYTKGIKIRREYRVHVFKGDVIDVVQKRRSHSNMEVSEFIRNHTHGWVFVREGFDTPEEVEREAVAAIEALSLDFGAVDLIVEKHTGKVYVLEVNTAPGFSEGSTTLRKYKEAIQSWLTSL